MRIIFLGILFTMQIYILWIPDIFDKQQVIWSYYSKWNRQRTHCKANSSFSGTVKPGLFSGLLVEIWICGNWCFFFILRHTFTVTVRCSNSLWNHTRKDHMKWTDLSQNCYDSGWHNRLKRAELGRLLSKCYLLVTGYLSKIEKSEA